MSIYELLKYFMNGTILSQGIFTAKGTYFGFIIA